MTGSVGRRSPNNSRVLADGALRRAMGVAGRDKVLRKYTWDLVARRVRAVYEEVCGVK